MARRASVDDVHALAGAMPGATRYPERDRAVYQVGGRSFVFFRTPRPDAFDADTGQRYTDVIVFWVPSESDKLALVQDPELPFFAVKPMQQRVDESLVSRRTPMMLASLFGGIALFLAAVGIYGVLAFQVAQRRKEIGIRMALGSDGRRIFGLIVTEGLWLLAIGVAVGLAGAFAIRRAMETQLYGVQPMDPLVLTAVTGTLGLVAFLACAVPARRAARIDPLIALTDQ